MWESERVSFKSKLFLQRGEQWPDSATGNMVPECWARSQVLLHSVAVVAVSFILLFGLAEVHCKKDVPKVSAMSRVRVSVGEQVHRRCSSGVQADDSSAGHQHPPFVLGWAGYICYTPSQRRISSPDYLYVDLKVWGIFSFCYCMTICWRLPHSCWVFIDWGGNGELNHEHPPAADSSVQQLCQKFIYVILRSSPALICRIWL